MALTDEGSGGNGMVMPVAPMMGYGNGGFGFGGDWAWILILLLVCGGGWGMGGFGGGAMWPMMMGGMGMDYGLYPWLNNSQHISDGFRDQQLNSQIGDARGDINRGFGDVQLGIAGVNQNLCQTGNGITSAVRDGFAQAEIANGGRHNALTQQLYTNQIADMERSYAAQTAATASANAIQSQLAQCCCDNRLATSQLQAVVQQENCSDRYEAAQNTRDIIESQNRVGQSILDKLCQLELDNYKTQLASAQRDNAALQNQVILATERADRTAQTAQILAGQNAQTDAIYNRFSSCPVGTVPVAGNTPLFACNPSFNNPGRGCGCGCGAA